VVDTLGQEVLAGSFSFDTSQSCSTASTSGPPLGSEEPPSPPEFPSTRRPWPGLDRLGLIQALGGLAHGLIALFFSYGHIIVAGPTDYIPKQWGILPSRPR
jgi:hypothetical protein